ncbi:MAG: DUF7657 domain-containing protein, partial [Planctomycetota bacterium]
KAELGRARAFRSDEFAVVTPTIQTVVASNYQEESKHSLFGENLRSLISLPFKDAWLLAKPHYWGFAVGLDPGRAYAFHWAFFMVAYVLGFAFFVRGLGASQSLAFLTALSLFFSQHTQAWFVPGCGPMALVVWLFVPLLYVQRTSLLLACTFACTTFCLFASPYPAWQITQFIAFVFLVGAFRPEVLKVGRLMPFAIGGLLGAGLAFVYYLEPAQVLAATVYPGQRRSAGGGVSLLHLASNLFPEIGTRSHEAVQAPNFAEASVVASWALLGVLVFGDWKAGLRKLKTKPGVLVALAPVALFLVWQHVAVPASYGQWLLLDRVPVHRTLLALGTTTVILAGLVAGAIPIRCTVPRILFFTVVAAASQYGILHALVPGQPLDWRDFLFLLVPASLFASQRVWTGTALVRRPGLVLVGSATLANVLAFGAVNPIQSTKVIFDATRTRNASTINQISQQRAGALQRPAVLAVTGMYGDLLTGLGLHATAYTARIPTDLDYQRALYPDLPAAQFNDAFNRYHHAIPELGRLIPESTSPDVVRTSVFAHAVEVPLERRFMAPSTNQGDADNSLLGERLQVPGPGPDGLAIFFVPAWPGVDFGELRAGTTDFDELPELRVISGYRDGASLARALQAPDAASVPVPGLFFFVRSTANRSAAWRIEVTQGPVTLMLGQTAPPSPQRAPEGPPR